MYLGDLQQQLGITTDDAETENGDRQMWQNYMRTSPLSQAVICHDPESMPEKKRSPESDSTDE